MDEGQEKYTGAEDVSAWIEQLRFEANYLAPEESRLLSIVLSLGLILVIAVSSARITGVTGDPIVYLILILSVLTLVILLGFRAVAAGGRLAQRSRRFAEEYRELASQVYRKDLEVQSIRKRYEDIKGRELKWLAKRGLLAKEGQRVGSQAGFQEEASGAKK